MEIATEDFGIRGRPTNAARVAILTGLDRREVARLRRAQEQSPGPAGAFMSKPTQVLEGWFRDPDFGDPKQGPRELDVGGSPHSFSELVRRYAPGLPVVAMIKALRGAGAIEETTAGRLRAVKRSYIPADLSEDQVRLWSSDLEALGTAVEHNLRSGKQHRPRFHRRAINLRVDPESLPAFQDFLEAEGRRFSSASTTGCRRTNSARGTPFASASASFMSRTEPGPRMHGAAHRRASPGHRGYTVNKFSSFAIAGMLGALLMAGCGSGSGAGDAGALPPPPSSNPPPNGNSGSGSPGVVAKTSCNWVRQGIEGTGRQKRTGIVESIGSDNSVVVDGVRYATRDASIVVNGACTSLDRLGIGRVVDVIVPGDGQSQDEIADAIFSDDAVAGEITSVHLSDGIFLLMGQAVNVNAQTVYSDSIHPAALSSLAPGDSVAVSGVLGEDGSLTATRIERWPSFATDLAAGVVSRLDIEPGVFFVNDVRVFFGQAVFAGFPTGRPAQIQNGDRVRIQGEWVVLPAQVPEKPPGLDAFAIEYVDPFSNSPLVVLSGSMTGWSNLGIEIDGVPVSLETGNGPIYVGHLLGPGIPFGCWITVVGPVAEDETLHSLVVISSSVGCVDLTGPVTALDADARSVSIAGIRFGLASETNLLESDVSGLRHGILPADLNIGDMVRVRGEASYPNRELAFQIVRATGPVPRLQVGAHSLYTRAELRPPLIDLPIGITGQVLTVETDANTLFYKGHINLPLPHTELPAEEFWRQADSPEASFIATDVVGTWTGNHVLATRVYWIRDI